MEMTFPVIFENVRALGKERKQVRVAGSYLLVVFRMDGQDPSIAKQTRIYMEVT